MTDDEQAAVLGEMASELAQARKRLVCLNAKADGFRKELNAAVAVLSHIDANVSPQPDENRFPTCAAIQDVRLQIQQTTGRIAELEEHLTRAGVIAPSP